MNDRVRLSISDGIAEVRLMRADKMNALDPAMFEAIASAGEQLKSDPDVRVVVVSGEARAFCAGLDVERITAATRSAVRRMTVRSAGSVAKFAGGRRSGKTQPFRR